MKLRELLSKGETLLKENNIGDYMKDGKLILFHLFDMDETKLFLNMNRDISKDEEDMFFSYISRRINHEPVQEILGYTYFDGNRFKVNKDVLKPRLETELILDECIKVIGEGKIKRVLDLCTGSGILGISLKKRFQDIDVTISDISIDALNVARENCIYNNVEISIIESDMFNSIEGKFDLIVSNPPYIPESDKDELSYEVINYDPEISLFGGSDGLKYYRIIGRDVCNYLNPNGYLILETGYNQGEDIREILKDKFKSIEVKKDYSNYDRIVIGEI